MTIPHTHFIGIGGIGMSALARLILEAGGKVSGSDLKENTLTTELKALGAKIYVGHNESNIQSYCSVVYSTGVLKDNPEYKKAIELRCPILHRSDLLAHLIKEKLGIAITGTHGKTTVSALTSHVLLEAGLDPTFAVGGVLPQFGVNSKSGKGPHFVLEACESDGSFIKYHSFGAIVTNIDGDHIDHFGTEKSLYDAFEVFISKVSHFLFYCGDDPGLQAINPKGISYGFLPSCDIVISNCRHKGWKTIFDIAYKGVDYKDIELSLPGRHSALNGAAVFGLALALGVKESSIRRAFTSFLGVLRRVEKKAEFGSLLFLDDYGHHPTEIKATLHGIRQAIGQRRLVVLYQPHRYSRAQYCQNLYKDSFDESDLLIVTDIYAAGENPIDGVSSKALCKELKKTALVSIEHMEKKDLIDGAFAKLRPHDVVLTLGAGDIVSLGEELLKKAQAQFSQKLKIGIIFGGVSEEHEISCLSAKHVASSLRADLYEPVYFAISKSGKWTHGHQATAYLENPSCISINIPSNRVLDAKIIDALEECDIFFPVLHGPLGEDGTIQGFFEILRKPYVGCDHRGAAICMDKALTKLLMQRKGIQTLDFLTYSRAQWISSKDSIGIEILEKMAFPLFIKPSHLGSSLGVAKVVNKEGLLQALNKAFMMDTGVIIEKAIEMREIEFAVIGNDEVEVFPPGEILSQGALYDYEAKYSDCQMEVNSVADLPSHIIEEGRLMAKSAYKAAGCMGMARVDMFLDKNNVFWLNEINPIPGFTKNSLYPLICQANGVSKEALVDRLIILGLERSL